VKTRCSGACPFAVPEKIFGLALFLDFFDRGTAIPLSFIRHRRRKEVCTLNALFVFLLAREKGCARASMSAINYKALVSRRFYLIRQLC